MASILNLDGRWRAQVRTKGHRVCRTFATEEDARNWAAQEEERISMLADGNEGNPTKGSSAYRVSGIYMLMLGKEVRYVGRSTHIYRRLNDHDRKATEWDRFQIWPCRDSIRAADLERKMIQRFQPPLNVAHKVAPKVIRKRKGRQTANFTSPMIGAREAAPDWSEVEAEA